MGANVMTIILATLCFATLLPTRSSADQCEEMAKKMTEACNRGIDGTPKQINDWYDCEIRYAENSEDLRSSGLTAERVAELKAGRQKTLQASKDHFCCKKAGTCNKSQISSSKPPTAELAKPKAKEKEKGKDMSHCVTWDRKSNTLADIIGNKCSEQIIVSWSDSGACNGWRCADPVAPGGKSSVTKVKDPFYYAACTYPNGPVIDKAKNTHSCPQ